jgi:hypothetical protein
VVLGIREKAIIRAIHQRVDRTFDALKTFLDDDFPAGVAKNAQVHCPMDRHRRLERILCNDHALAQRKAIRLNNQRILRTTAPRVRVETFGKLSSFRRWNPMTKHKILGENLR